MKILVTGSSGFVGTHLREKLQGYELICPDRKFFNEANIRDFLEEEKIRTVIHLATHFVRFPSEEDREELEKANIHFGLKILRALKEIPGATFINTGSAWQNTGPSGKAPWNLYAETKETFSRLLMASSINNVTLKLYETYGDRDPRDKVLNLIDRAARSGEALKLSPGFQRLDFCHVDDIVRSYGIVLRHLKTEPDKVLGKEFFLSGQRVSLRELVQVYTEATGREVPVVWGAIPYRVNEIMEPFFTSESLPDWKSEINLYDGIRKTFLNR